MFITKMILYAVLGVLLSRGGIYVMEQTALYLGIMLMVVGIDFCAMSARD